MILSFTLALILGYSPWAYEPHLKNEYLRALEDIRVNATTPLPTFNIESYLSYETQVPTPEDTLETFLEIEKLVFTKNGFVQIIVIDSKSPYEVSYDLATHSVVLSNAFLAKLQQEYSPRDAKNILRFTIAHEISHFILANYCRHNDMRTPMGNTCSMKVAEDPSQIPWKLYYEFRKAYGLEHAEVDYFAYLILKKLNVRTKAIHHFLKNSPIPYGESKRITDILQLERQIRIDLAKKLL